MLRSIVRGRRKQQLIISRWSIVHGHEILSMAFKFENLKVWKKAIELSSEIHELTKTFPKEEIYILTSQIKRATDSISLNIAEGSTRQSNKEFKRFLGIALRSGIEVVSCLHLAKGRKLIDQREFDKHYNSLTEIIKNDSGFTKDIVTIDYRLKAID